MELSGRIFGFNSWSMLVPQAIEGVLRSGCCYATVKRWFGPTAGLLAGALLAHHAGRGADVPVQQPRRADDAADRARRLLRDPGARGRVDAWLLLAGAAMGFSFLAKGLQPFTVLPALAIAYLVAAPTRSAPAAAAARCRRGAGRRRRLVGARRRADAGRRPSLHRRLGQQHRARPGLRLQRPVAHHRQLSGGRWRWRRWRQLQRRRPASAGCSTRSTAARSPGCCRPRCSRSSRWSSSRGGRARTDRTRAALIIWGGWLLVTGAVLSFASGIIHTYYTVELAPAIAALVAIGDGRAVARARRLAARVGLAAGVLVTGVVELRAAAPQPSVGTRGSPTLVLVAGVVGAVALLVPPGRGSRAGCGRGDRSPGSIALAGGSAAYALDTAATPHTGCDPVGRPDGERRRRLRRRPGRRWRRLGGGPAAAGGSRRRHRRPAVRHGGGVRPAALRPAARMRPAARCPSGGTRGRVSGGQRRHRSASTALALTAAEERTTRSGPRRRSARSRRPARAASPARRSWRSAASAAATTRRRSRSSRSCVAEGKIHYFIGGGQWRAEPAGGGGRSAITQLGGGALHRDDRRRHDRLRPDEGERHDHRPSVPSRSTVPSGANRQWRDQPTRAGRAVRGIGFRLRRAAARHRAAVPGRAVRVGLGQPVLLGRGRGRQQELDGVPVRLARLVQLHHRRQAAGLAVGDGPVGADLRPELVVDPGAAGARGRGRGRAAVRRGASACRRRPPGCSPARSSRRRRWRR